MELFVQSMMPSLGAFSMALLKNSVSLQWQSHPTYSPGGKVSWHAFCCL
jgi:hypothetical protein